MAVHPRRVGAFRRRSALNIAIGLGAVGMLGASAPAYALSCGDVVGPGGTAVLDKDLVCDRSPALIAEGPVVLDLQGFTIGCALHDKGTLAGTGIKVIGSEAEVRNGQVENCRRGIHVKGDGHHLLKRLSVTSAAGVGGGEPIAFLVQSDHNRFIRNTVRAYAGEGFRLDGANVNMLKRNKAIDNADHGFRVRRGRRNVFLWNRALRNGGEGFRSQDRDNRFDSNTAIENGDEGIRLRDESAQNNLVTNNTVKRCRM